MSLSEDRAFLTELVLRFDPDLDVSEGSRADTELIQPILTRIGIDPIDEDTAVFVRERVRQAMAGRMAISEVDELTDVLIDPCRVLFEPVIREIKLVRLRSSLQNTTSLADAEVDGLMANFFEDRVTGGYAVGVIRAYYAQPQTISVTQSSVAATKSGLRFTPIRSQAITRDEMVSNIDGTEYYFDMNYIAEARGDEYNVDRGEIVSIANMPTATRVTNLRHFRDGTPQETSVDFVARVQRGGGTHALVSEPGIYGAIERAFPEVRGILVTGFGDAEMQRDVIKGGGLGPVPADDDFGHFYGAATLIDDGNADATTSLLSVAGGALVARVAPVGGTPDGWFLSLTYLAGTPVVVDAQILEVRADTVVKIDHEVPLTATGIVWSLRRRELTLSDIPGGITLPNTADGELVITSNEVHIGGKVDIYVGGSSETLTATITSLSDEDPLTVGQNAQTQASSAGEEDIIILNDLSIDPELIEPGMSLVLTEGVDVGSYRILEVLDTPDRVRVAQEMTGTQGSLAWKIVDDISTELTDPKDIKASGSDLVTAAGNSTVFTASAFSFLNAGVAEDDVLEILGTQGGEFIVQEVGATTLVVSPAPPGTLAAAAWRVFTRSEGVQAPIVNVQSLELLDPTGAPNGTKIPLRDPVLVQSRAFQNEGEGFVRDDYVLSGIISPSRLGTGNVITAGQSFDWKIMDADAPWGLVAGGDSGTFIFLSNVTVDGAVAAINADATLQGRGVRAVKVLDEGGTSRLGMFASRFLQIVDTDISPTVLPPGITNANVTVATDSVNFTSRTVQQGDLIDFYGGSNSGLSGRVVRRPTLFAGTTVETIFIAKGPAGPTPFTDGLYDVVLLAPAVERARMGRASVGSARVYFLDPTSAEFPYQTTQLELDGLRYQPDPENRRQILPPVPDTAPVRYGTFGLDQFSDATRNFLLLGVKPGDLLEPLFRAMQGSAAMVSPANVPVGGTYLRLSIGTAPFITISFPFNMPRASVVDYINEQAGDDIARLNAGVLVLEADELLTIDPTSTAITDGADPLRLSALVIDDGITTSRHEEGRSLFIIAAVQEHLLLLSPATSTAPSYVEPNVSYRIHRYLQRISSTEMNTQVDASGLYYMDLQLQSVAPGDQYNIPASREMLISGHVSDGYRLSTESEVLSYSRAEILNAEISRSILLVGSSDSPQEALQLSRQSVMVTYGMSRVVDDVQSFANSASRRAVCSEPLARHLLPHFVSLTWNYVGGQAEAATTRALLTTLDDPDLTLDGLEVLDLVRAVQSKGATSVYITDPESPTGRAAPVIVVVYHGTDRSVRATIVSDVVSTVRTQKFLPGTITLRRATTGGIR
jgi:hypothetical protein